MRSISSYRAPELVRNHQYINKVDIWAVDCIVYELLLGQKAFIGDIAVFQFSVSEDLLEFLTNVIIEESIRSALYVHLQVMFSRNPKFRLSAIEISCEKFWVPEMVYDEENPYAFGTDESPDILWNPNVNVAIGMIGESIAIRLIAEILCQTIKIDLHIVKIFIFYFKKVRKFNATLRL